MEIFAAEYYACFWEYYFKTILLKSGELKLHYIGDLRNEDFTNMQKYAIGFVE